MKMEILFENKLVNGDQPILRSGPLVLTLIWVCLNRKTRNEPSSTTTFHLRDEAENRELGIFTDYGAAVNAFLHERAWRQKT